MFLSCNLHRVKEIACVELMYPDVRLQEW